MNGNKNIKKIIIVFLLATLALFISAVVAPAMAHAGEAEQAKISNYRDLYTDGQVRKVTYKFLRKRSKPTTDSKCKGKFKKGDRFVVYERKGEWGRIGHNLWVNLDSSYSKVIRDGWYKRNGSWEYYISKTKKTIRSNSCHQVNEDYWFEESRTNQMIITDKSKHMTYVFVLVDNRWCPRAAVHCNLGIDGHETPRGEFRILEKKSYFDKNGKTFRYCMRYAGRRYYHSTAYYYHSKTAMKGIDLGNDSTHGCIAMVPSVAKWMYKNVGVGSKVIVI